MLFAVREGCGCCFLDAVSCRLSGEPAHPVLFLVSGWCLGPAASQPFDYKLRAGAHLHIITPIHPSLPDAPVLAAPRTVCCDSKFGRPTGDCRVLARALQR